MYRPAALYSFIFTESFIQIFCWFLIGLSYYWVTNPLTAMIPKYFLPIFGLAFNFQNFVFLRATFLILTEFNLPFILMLLLLLPDLRSFCALAFGHLITLAHSLGRWGFHPWTCFGTFVEKQLTLTIKVLFLDFLFCFTVSKTVSSWTLMWFTAALPNLFIHSSSYFLRLP